MDSNFETSGTTTAKRAAANRGIPVKRLLLVLATVPFAILPILASKAFADYKITKPSNPYVFVLNTHGVPVPFDVQSTGWRFHQLVFIEICDGKPATAAGWSPGLDCDDETSPAPVAASATGMVTFPANNSNFAIVTFHGASPNGSFNCLAKNEIPRDAIPKTQRDTNGRPFTYYLLSAKDKKAPDGASLSPASFAWTDCQLRVASNYASATNDQQFISLVWPAINDPAGSSGTSPGLYAAIGVGVILVLGSAYFVLRRGQATAR